MDSEQLAQALKVVLEEKKGVDIELMDLRERSTFTDFFLVATGTSTTHAAALAEEVDRFAHQNKHPVIGSEGTGNSQWILVDLGDVIVHVFLAETRSLYSLDKLWSRNTLLLNRQQADAPELSGQDDESVLDEEEERELQALESEGYEEEEDLDSDDDDREVNRS
ncbi:MAG: ribosome silencing factor [Magnetococcales bacterium]|nr:ribosome silencing factor [Magnetococcales bacterium]